MNPLLVGRGSECAIRLVDETVSRRHATVSLDGAQIEVVDQSSANGTFVARGASWARIDRIVLTSNMKIKFGNAILSFEELATKLRGLAADASRRRAEGAASIPRGPIVANVQPADAVLNRPRRNPKTGLIEEK